MAFGNDDKNAEPSRIEELEQKLYSKKEDAVRPPKRTELRPKRFYVREDWEKTGERDGFLELEKHEPGKRISAYAKLLLGSSAFFAIALCVGAYFFLTERNLISPENVELSVVGPVSIRGGEVLDLQIVVENKNAAPLTSAKLELQFPQGTRSPNDSSREFLRYAKTLSPLSPGEIRIESVKAILIGDERSLNEISASLEYRIESSSAQYSKEQKYTVRLTAPPLALSLETLDEANSGQEITLKARISSGTAAPLENPLLRIEYPKGFVFRRASPAPSAGGNNTWSLGRISYGETREISITGVLQGENGQEKAFRGYVGFAKEDAHSSIGTIFSTAEKTVAIKKPFIGVEIFADGVSGPEYFILDRERSPVVSIRWKNNLPDRIVNGEIRAVVKGASIDRRNITATQGGFYRSSDDTILWERRTTPELALIGRGETNSVTFTLPIRPPETSGFVMKEPTIEIEVSVRGERISEKNVPEEVNSFAKKILKVGTVAQFAASALALSGPFKNSGPLPPKVGEETEYTIIWTVKNLSSALSGARMQATLPPYVRATGAVYPSSGGFSINESSGEIVWDIGAVPPGTGVETPAKEISFQIALRPSLSHVGKSPVIVSSGEFSAIDTFTGNILQGELLPISTALKNSDPLITHSMSAVVP